MRWTEVQVGDLVLEEWPIRRNDLDLLVQAWYIVTNVVTERIGTSVYGYSFNQNKITDLVIAANPEREVGYRSVIRDEEILYVSRPQNGLDSILVSAKT